MKNGNTLIECVLRWYSYYGKYIRQSILESESAKDYLKSVGENFTRFDTNNKCEYHFVFEKTKYDGVSGVKEYIMKLIHYYNKLKSLKLVSVL